MSAVVHVNGLTKRYGALEAVKSISFDIDEGEVFGLLGPNGAGKTSTVEILEGLRPRDAGQVTVLGIDPGRQSLALRDRIGVSLQATNLPAKMTVGEAIWLFSRLYTRSVDGTALLRRLQLADRQKQAYGTLSGGQQQRLALALALLNDPQLLFLDEPSAGLDPQARLEIHTLVQELRAERRTVLLTTHYIEEAEKLCDRVAIIDEGRVLAMGTPREIQSRTIGSSVIEVHCQTPPGDEVPASVQAAGRLTRSDDGRTLTVSSTRPARTLVDLVKWIDAAGIELEDVSVKRPSLEDVFIELTGKSLRE